MRKRIVFFALVLISLGFVFGSSSVKAAKPLSGSIYIRADGSIAPKQAPISSSDKVTYYFTDDIEGANIVVERSNIIVDGNGFTLIQEGFILSDVFNVTVQNTIVSGIEDGESFILSSVTHVTINNCSSRRQIKLSSSSNNTIIGNEISGTKYSGSSIYLDSSSFNNISGNNLGGSNDQISGVFLSSSSFNSIHGNTIKSAGDCGIRLSSSSFNNISGNHIWYCSSKGPAGILLHSSSNNIILRNNIENIDGWGIRLEDSSSNTISGNNITENWDHGVSIKSSSNNKFYHNNFIDNYRDYTNSIDNYFQVYSENSINVWDNGYPSGGNYWSDYTGIDEYSGVNQDESGRDGISDTPYIIDLTNQDNYPVMDVWPNPPWLPVSSFVHAPLAPVVYETLTFNASASYDVDGDIVDYTWDFDDGTTSTERDAITTHSYTYPGTYTVTLNVINEDGLLDTSSTSIDISKIPTSITIATSSPSTFVGFKVNMTGTLQDMYGRTLRDETVVLYYTFSGINTWTPITSDTTDTLGTYFAQWIPPAAGYFVVKAEWAGNATHLGASNTTTLSSLVHDNQYIFTVESNSTISELAFDTENWQLSFTATGPDDTRGSVKVTVAKSLVTDIANIRVYLDGRQSQFMIVSTDDSWLLTFSYDHSTRQVEVDLDTIIPDATSPTIWIQSPENTTYTVHDVPLNFTISESTSWIGYSLDDHMNVTISGNTTVVGLSEGLHTITVYAHDATGNTGYSDTVYFTITPTQHYITVISTYGSPPPSQGVDGGGSVTVSVTSPVGGAGTRYRCAGYRIDDGDLHEGTSYTFEDVQASHAITFEWIPQYQLTVASTPSALSPQPRVSPLGPWYDKGTHVALTAETVSGYAFDHWQVDGVSQGTHVNTITVEMNQPHDAISYYTETIPRILWSILGVVVVVVSVMLGAITVILAVYFSTSKPA